MKTGTVLCNQCNKTFSVYIHRLETQGNHINTIDNCKHHSNNNNKKNTVHKRLRFNK